MIMKKFNEYLQSRLDDLHNQSFYKEANEFKKAILDTYFRETIEEAYSVGYLDGVRNIRKNDRILNFKKVEL